MGPVLKVKSSTGQWIRIDDALRDPQERWSTVRLLGLFALRASAVLAWYVLLALLAVLLVLLAVLLVLVVLDGYPLLVLLVVVLVGLLILVVSR